MLAMPIHIHVKKHIQNWMGKLKVEISKNASLKFCESKKRIIIKHNYQKQRQNVKIRGLTYMPVFLYI